MKKILVPTDFSSCAINALDFALQSARYLPVEIHLLYVYESREDLYTDYVGLNKEFRLELQSEAQEKLDQLKKEVEEKEGIMLYTHLSLRPFTESVLEIS